MEIITIKELVDEIEDCLKTGRKCRWAISFDILEEVLAEAKDKIIELGDTIRIKVPTELGEMLEEQPKVEHEYRMPKLPEMKFESNEHSSPKDYGQRLQQRGKGKRRW